MVVDILARPLKTDTGEIIAAATAHAAVPFVDPSTANTKALAEAATRISRKLDWILRELDHVVPHIRSARTRRTG